MEKTREEIMQEMLQDTQQNINESAIGKEEFLTEVAIPGTIQVVNEHDKR